MRAEEGLRQTLEPAHIQLLSQISKLPGGVKNIVDMRCDLLVRAVSEISENFELKGYKPAPCQYLSVACFVKFVISVKHQYLITVLLNKYQLGISCSYYSYRRSKKCILTIIIIISNSNWTEWSTIQGVIGRVILKSAERDLKLRARLQIGRASCRERV